MADEERNEYVPDAVSAPGETLTEVLAAVGMSQAELADRTGRPKKTINEIIKGKAMITSETAVQLERVLGVEASFWTSREASYRAHLARLDEEHRLRASQHWPSQFPIKEMQQKGWIRRATGVELVRELLSFFAIASPEAFDATYDSAAYEFRSSTKFEVDRKSLAAWLRRGELVAKEVACAPFDRQRFIDVLAEARKLTLLPPDHYVPRLAKLCSAAGVVLAFVQEMPRTRTNGATKWLSPTKALIQLSVRYKRNDILWFTFFHEAGHILLHGKKETFVDIDASATSEKERQADEFAASALIPSREMKDFAARADFSEDAVTEFANSSGVHPAVVVGRLRHDKLVPPNHLAHLIVRVTEDELLRAAAMSNG